MPAFKIYIETTIIADTPGEARAVATTYLTNPNEEDIELALAAVERGFTANPSSYHHVVVSGRESRDLLEAECERLARSHGWDQAGGKIFNCHTHPTQDEAIADPDGITYDSWAECCREEGFTEERTDTFADAVESTVSMAQSGAIAGGDMADRRVPRYGSGKTMEVETPPLDTNDPCHPVMQRIRLVQIDTIPDQQVCYEVDRAAGNGFGLVTLIEACTKPGPHSEIPYVRVWSGRESVAEFCQHHIVGVYYFPKG